MQHKYTFDIVKVYRWKDYKYIDLIATDELNRYFPFSVRMVRGSDLEISDWIFSKELDNEITCEIINQLKDYSYQTILDYLKKDEYIKSFYH